MEIVIPMVVQLFFLFPWKLASTKDQPILTHINPVFLQRMCHEILKPLQAESSARFREEEKRWVMVSAAGCPEVGGCVNIVLPVKCVVFPNGNVWFFQCFQSHAGRELDEKVQESSRKKTVRSASLMLKGCDLECS